jgi:hypothetical protein
LGAVLGADAAPQTDRPPSEQVRLSPIDARLATVIEAWPKLPERVREAITLLVQSCSPEF